MATRAGSAEPGSVVRAWILLAAFAAAMYGQILPPGLGPAAAPAGATAPQADMGPNTVVATVAGISVTLADVRKILETAPAQLAQQFKQNPQQALGQVYLMKYLASEGEKAHLDQKSPLKEEIEELIALLKQQVLANAMVNEEQNGFLVSDQQIDDFYQKNQSRWEEAKIKIILIAFKPAPTAPAKTAAEASPVPGGAAPAVTDALQAAALGALEGAHALNERTQAEAQKLAGDLVKQLRGGADFAKLVTQYSDDAESKPSGGDFGTPIKATSSFAQDLKKTVLAMKPGEISDPVPQGYGYYIIRLEQKTVQPINDVRESIVKELKDNHLHDYLTGLDNRFKPQVLRPDFFAQPSRFLSPPQ
jgi:parvulin-like peptidyl-prolyl isomerase